MKKSYIVAELARLAYLTTNSKNHQHIYLFYPELERAHAALMFNHFNLDIGEFEITEQLVRLIITNQFPELHEYILELMKDDKFKDFNTEVTFDERVALAKDLLEIDMTYRKKQQEYNAKGLYIHFHTIMSFHRKLSDALCAVKTPSE